MHARSKIENFSFQLDMNNLLLKTQPISKLPKNYVLLMLKLETVK